MNSNKIKDLVDELCNKKVQHVYYDKTSSEVNLIDSQNRTILEQIIRKHILDNHDEKLGTLEAKVKFYEEMITKSTFAPMLVKEEKEVEQIIEPEPYQREMIFTQRQIEHLQHQVYLITGEGEVMNLFNQLLWLKQD